MHSSQENSLNIIYDITREHSGLVRSESGFVYRDLNKNNKLDVYEDPRQPIEARIDDLLSQMTIEEKAGTLFYNGALVNEDGSIDDKPGADFPGIVASAQIADLKMNHFNLWQIPGAQMVAVWQNNIQKFAESTRLGIPITIASDPRNHFSKYIFALPALDFSQWCETLGFAAIDDQELVKEFIEVVRQEYLAVGIRVALHPQIDLATEPRWSRIYGTFGEDAHLTARLTKAYIEAFQGRDLGPDSVACMTKHFPGGGPQKEGLDSHFEFQKGQIYPGDNFDYHLIPFEAAIQSQTAALMLYYGVPVDQTDENVAMGFNKTIVTTLLREKYQYDKVICTDWGLITDFHLPETIWPARAWGVEHLSEVDRVKKVLDAGVDQFGGESRPELVVELVENGQVAESRIDESVRRILRQKFQLGLFDNPFVDLAKVAEVLGKPASLAAGVASQSRAMTLLKNEDQILPLRDRPKIYIQGIDASIAAQYGEVVPAPEDADFAVLRLDTPWYPVDTLNPFAKDFHHGDMDFKGEVKAEILAILERVPSIVIMYLDRPAVIPEISAAAKGLLGEYGASDGAILDVVFGKSKPEGKLPFELPSSMDAVRKQRADVPYDSEDPLYPFGFGLSY
jgi:beta-glucosidase